MKSVQLQKNTPKQSTSPARMIDVMTGIVAVASLVFVLAMQEAQRKHKQDEIWQRVRLQERLDAISLRA